MVHVVHCITGLQVGGAELALARLVGDMDPNRFTTHVVALGPDGPVGAQLREAGHRVTALGATDARATVRAASRLVRLLRAERPDVVQTWLYHSDVLAGLVARALRTPAVVWSLRSSDLHPDAFKAGTTRVAHLEARLSGRVPHAIVCGSEAARRFHEHLGFASDRMLVIPNGVERPVLPAGTRERVRTQLGLPPNAPVLVRLGRLHPHKDYPGLLTALGSLAQRYPELHVVLAGDGLVRDDPALAALVAATGMSERIHLLGRRDDVPQLLAAADLSCSSSTGEGFPNAVAEAMAARLPVVTTDVGDSAHVVGDTGFVVPPRDPAALAAALAQALDMAPEERARRATAARRRVEEHFPVDLMARRHEELYLRLLGRAGRSVGAGGPAVTPPRATGATRPS